MNGGNGPSSYARNSSYQRRAIETAEAFLRKEIPARVNLTNRSFSSFTIADFGCSSGPNTILAVDIIIQALDNKFSSSMPKTKTPAFQVFFNDVSHTDFNALFALLPPQRPYFVAGVPGSFYGNLFPKASLNLAYSSCALCWISELPPELSDTTSPAYNKSRIHYTGAQAEVAQAYSCQYEKDIKSFLSARSHELAEDGLMALIVPGVPDGFLESQSQASTGSEFNLLGSCFMDMAREGVIKEEQVDSFNLPVYYPTPKELEDIIISNGELAIEKMVTLDGAEAQDTMPELESRVLYLRAALEGLIRTHFGHQILDDLFDRYSLKLAHSSFILNPQTHKSIMIFTLLTRRH
ncbi:hypothetical protein AALP_AA1G170500 [Arabis alpina]|uniref:S-adenosylmethionine-dependent methyltransferase n=1 Tax=Arabis alpina TaxID=50452 RepID=A0A087HNR7_ARAAL|nr:hypothetical protein AALP_AA1G170500 [Arabis alpina]